MNTFVWTTIGLYLFCGLGKIVALLYPPKAPEKYEIAVDAVINISISIWGIWIVRGT